MLGDRHPTMMVPNRIDKWLMIIAFLIALWGVVMVYSASINNALKETGSSLFYLEKQIAFSLAGIAAMLLASRMDYRKLASRKIVYFTLLGTAILLVLVLLIGHKAGGASRWLRIGPIGFQPGELSKFAVVLFLAASIARKGDEKMQSFSLGVLPHVMIPVFFIGLLMLQPDFGSSVIIVGTVGLMLFTGGIRWRYLIIGSGAAAALGALAIKMEPYRLRRVLAFTDPWSDFHGSGYHTIQSLIAFGSGGIFGRGLGNGRQKLWYLPAIHTDFIFSNVGEELGFIGVVATILAFTVLLVRASQIARRASEPFGRHLAWGVLCLLGLEIVMNLGVVMALLPTKGLALPFMSYGGTSIVVNFFLVGVLLSVSRWADMEGTR